VAWKVAARAARHELAPRRAGGRVSGRLGRSGPAGGDDGGARRTRARCRARAAGRSHRPGRRRLTPRIRPAAFVRWSVVCSRYALKTRGSDEIRAGLAEALGVETAPSEQGFGRFNIAPRQEVLAVVDDRGGRRIKELRWGLVPHWANELNSRFSMINACAETIDQRPAYRRLVARSGSRCLILADGWYEWQRPEDPRQPKRPLHFSLAGSGVFASPVCGPAGPRPTARWSRAARSSPARRTSWSDPSTTACRLLWPAARTGWRGWIPPSTALRRASCLRRSPRTVWSCWRPAQWSTRSATRGRTVWPSPVRRSPWRSALATRPDAGRALGMSWQLAARRLQSRSRLAPVGGPPCGCDPREIRAERGLVEAVRLERGDGAEDRVAYGPSGRAVERDDLPQRWRHAADALAATSRRQVERLEPLPYVIGMAVAEDEGDAPGGFERSVGSDPCEQQALGPSRLGRTPAGHQERLGAAMLVLDPGAVAGGRNVTG
jgi:hypothetical protein